MKKIVILLLFFALVLSGCGQKKVVSKLEEMDKQGAVKQKEAKTEETKAGGLADVCNYFPKELIESAIGKPIVKVEVPITGSENCFYYTFYSDDYDHTPYGDKPGGTPVVAVYDTEDFAKDKAYNETHGSKYGTDPSIGMDNYVVRNNTNEVWQVVLILGGDKYIRMHYVHDAVTGDELVKIGAKFAEKIQAGK
ncbi:MAG: hypothetical protein WCV70_03945 [Patescibacteria group bacterium]|jgi:hypothetical protein